MKLKKLLISFSFFSLSFIVSACGVQPTPQATVNTPPTETSPVNSIEVATTSVAVSIKDFVFNPEIVNIEKGTTVIWTNTDSVSHKLKSEIFSSDRIGQGETFSFTFDNVGTFDYYCVPHPSMVGKIIVK